MGWTTKQKVLKVFPKASLVQTERYGEKYGRVFPIYEIRLGHEVLAEGCGTTDAWDRVYELITGRK